MTDSGRLFFFLMLGFAAAIAAAGTAIFLTSSRIPQAAVTTEAREPEEVEEDDRTLVEVEGIPASYGLGTIKPFWVRSRKEALEYYPCADCHEDEPINPRERVLTEEHEDKKLDHGGGRFWCLTCHGSKNKNTLTSLKGKPISFDTPFLLCGQCHFQRQKDWYMGGHGKRVGPFAGEPHTVPLYSESLKVEDRDLIGRWEGKRVVKVCPECHNPHSPSIKPFEPSPAPGVRRGLVRRQPHEAEKPTIWVRRLKQIKEGR